ncbi:MAG TPA: ankyrin repeat domain-containing protein, partial [Candidatus Babeliales bacterium]|nr:ankyrin repeat domain-containing protein [Candidatus Babeliales bacterium]
MLRNTEINILRLQKVRLQRQLTVVSLLALMSCCAQVTPLHSADGSGAPAAGAASTGGSVDSATLAEKQANGEALLNAADGNDIAAVTRLLALPPALLDINYPYDDGSTALMYAADCFHEEDEEGCDHTAIVQALLAQAGIAINHADRAGNTALMAAAINGHTAMAQALLAQDGIEINHAGQDGETSLMIAAAWGHTAIVQALIAAGAEIPADFSAHQQILTVPLALRQLPALV